MVGWCSGKHRVFCIQVGACINPVGAGIFRELVLPSSGCYRNQRVGALKQVGACISGSRCFHLVGGGTLRDLVLPSSGARETRE